jgi:predicted SprT family Zn-dependent metalloprotease
MTNWTKKLVKFDEDDYNLGTGEYEYRCGCGNTVDDDLEYNADTGHYECSECGSESPDLENIEYATHY